MRAKLFSKLLNIGKHEWPRVIVCWIITFFLRVGFIVGWTVVIAMFVNRMGIIQLPFLFILHAFLVIAGTLIFSGIIRRVRKEIVIIINILLAAMFLISASIFVAYSNWLFFGLVLIAESMMLAQLNILISAFVEEMFTPLESQRTFPIVESSETIGLIAGGIIVSTLAHSIPSYKFLYIWVLFIMLVIPIILSFKSLNTEIPSFKAEEKKRSSIKTIAKNLKEAQKSPFLKILIVIIIFQWMFINLLEFQYTKSVQQNVYEEREETLVYENALNNTMKVSTLDLEITEEKLMTTAYRDTSDMDKAQSSQSYEDSLTARLGLLQVFFGIATLLMQILVSGRILKRLGIIKSMTIHPHIGMITATLMALKFNIFSASISKGAVEMTGLLFQNAYHSSYYAFGEKIRDQMKELLEGIIKPAGAILGMSFIILLENFLFGENLTLTINLTLIIIAILSISLISRLQTEYTKQSQKNIERGNSNHTRLNAIEILAQKGHKIDYRQLIKTVQRENESEEIKLKVIETLKEIKDPKTIPHLISCLSSANKNVRLAVVEALGEFRNLEKHFLKSAFGQHRIQENLKKLFEEEEYEEIRYAIVQVLSKLNPKDIVPFLLEKLQSKDSKITADCIHICGLFHDPNSIHYLEKFLDHKDPKIRTNSIIALWQFDSLRSKLEHYLDQLIKSEKKENRLLGVRIIGELELKGKRSDLLKMLPNKEIEVVFALGHLSEQSVLPKLVDYIMENKKDWESISKKINKLPGKFLNTLKQFLHQEISYSIHKILTSNSHLKPEEYEKETLEELMHLYTIINEAKTKEEIRNLIKQK
ncbi:MAG: ATP/ADP translocase-like protein [uncultured bacterium]|nr:MAG: ATP/ADP translocase-like protein [uncultured bacterium]